MKYTYIVTAPDYSREYFVQNNAQHGVALDSALSQAYVHGSANVTEISHPSGTVRTYTITHTTVQK